MLLFRCWTRGKFTQIISTFVDWKNTWWNRRDIRCRNGSSSISIAQQQTYLYGSIQWTSLIRFDIFSVWFDLFRPPPTSPTSSQRGEALCVGNTRVTTLDGGRRWTSERIFFAFINNRLRIDPLAVQAMALEWVGTSRKWVFPTIYSSTQNELCNAIRHQFG